MKVDKRTTPQYSIKLRVEVGELLNQWIAEYRHVKGVHLNKSNAIMKLVKYFVDNEKGVPLSNWQKIETAPQNTMVLVTWVERHGFNGRCAIAKQYPNGLFSCAGCKLSWSKVPTHWMPLPPLP